MAVFAMFAQLEMQMRWLMEKFNTIEMLIMTAKLVFLGKVESEQ